MASVCPKCGSNRILNDECLQCGIIISRFLATAPAGLPASAPPAPQREQPRSFDLQDAARKYRDAERKRRLQGRIITAVVLLLVSFGAWKIYTTLERRAAAYTGLYKDGVNIYSMSFKTKGWSHYSKDDLKVLAFPGIEFRNVSDAFYMGEPDNPDAVMAMWQFGGEHAPDRFYGNEIIQKFRRIAVEEMEQKLAPLSVAINSWEQRWVAENAGFYFDTSLSSEQGQFHVPVYFGFKEGRHYIFLVWSRDETRTQELAKALMSTLSFNINMI